MQEIRITSKALTKLFSDIGGEESLATILKAFYLRMAQDLLIGFFFSGKDLEHIANQQKSFLMRAWGISPSYAGKPPAEAHEKIPPILAGHFDRRLVLLEETLRAFKVSEENIQVWTSFEGKFRRAIQADSE